MEASQLRYSVLLASRNEGERLRRTVDDVLRHAPAERVEIVIVDDASDDDSTAFVTHSAYADKPIRSVRNDRHRGLIYSRARAADLARGPYLAFLDAHCAVSPGWLEALADELAQIDDRGLVAPAIYKLRSDWTIDIEGGGVAGCTLSSPFLDFTWAAPWKIDGRSCTCTIGGGAWMCHRQWFRHIGGMDRAMVVWGLENIDVPLRTWAAGGWCLAAENVMIGHLFNETPVFFMSDVDFVYNKIRAAHNVFSAETFKKVMQSLMYLGGFREALTRVHDERETLTPQKDYFESIRKRSDAWLIDTFRLPLLEDPSYHIAPRRPKPVGKTEVPRPSVCVVVPVRGATEDGEALVRSLLRRTTYGNFEVLVAVSDGETESNHLVDIAESWRSHPRVRVVDATASAPGDVVNAAASSTDADFLALLPPDTLDVDPHWLEQLLLLAERRPRLLMACPRTRWRDGRDRDRTTEDSFEMLWDWDAPGFLRQRTGQPLASQPYPVLTCPETLLLLNRTAFVHLGGFDPTVDDGMPLLDLTIRGWLSGFEAFCHPGVSVVRRSRPRCPADSEPRSATPALEYTWVLPAVKCFSGARRHRCQQRYPGAEPLLRQHSDHIDRRRSEFLAGTQFDDDWLFFKFNLEESPMTTAPRVPVDIQIELEVRATYPIEPGRLVHVLKVLRQSGGRLRAHLVYRLYDQAVAFFLCERPSDAALALEGEEGVEVETETVVTVRTRNRPGLLGHLVQTLEAEKIDVSYSYATTEGDAVLVVLRTGDNPRTEDVLRGCLWPADET